MKCFTILSFTTPYNFDQHYLEGIQDSCVNGLFSSLEDAKKAMKELAEHFFMEVYDEAISAFPKELICQHGPMILDPNFLPEMKDYDQKTIKISFLNPGNEIYGYIRTFTIKEIESLS